MATIALLAGSTFGQVAKKTTCLNKIGQKEWTILLSDLDPARKKSLEDPALRKDQVDNMRSLLAFACEADSIGLTSDETNVAELDFIRAETIAVAYDRKKNKVKPAEPLSWITDAQVVAFYRNKANEAAFENFFETKTKLLVRAGAIQPSAAIPPEQEAEAKVYFAKIKLAEAAAKLMTPAERAAAEFKAKIQQAQFLARMMSEQVAGDLVVSNEEIAEYIVAHPELSPKDQRAKAVKIKDRAKAGEDFATLANEFSDDPGNSGSDGKKNGGLYANVAVGMMVEPFEKASLALEPGQISDVVETDFGFHVIKLERRSADRSNYDVRHILVATGYKDPNDPEGRTVPTTIYVRTKLEGEREANIIKEIVAKNAVVVEDIKLVAAPAPRTVPKTTRPVTRPASRKR